MRISRKLYSLLLACVLSLLVTAPAESQVVCWWCLEVPGMGHIFYENGEGCASDVAGGPSTVECVRCGGSSDCHDEGWQEGSCHIKCGPAGGLAMEVVDGLLDAIAEEDVARLASALRQEKEGFSLDFIPEGGRIEVTLACSPVSPFRTIVILPTVREALEREIAKAWVV